LQAAAAFNIIADDVGIGRARALNFGGTFMVRLSIAVVITAFWGVMMFLLVKREVIPAYSIQRDVTFKDVVGRHIRPETTRMDISLRGGPRIGESVSITKPLADGGYHLTNKTDVKLEQFGPLGRIRTSSLIALDANCEVHNFSLELETAVTRVTCRGRVIGKFVELTLEGAGGRRTMTVPYDPGATLQEGLSPFAPAANLAVGKQWTIQSLNFFTGTMTKHRASVESREMMEFNGKEEETFVVAIEMGRVTAQAWVTPDGRVLREEVPLGTALGQTDVVLVFLRVE
jgi:hypothetical protein